MKMIIKNRFVKKRNLVVVLSFVCALLFAAVGCKENVESKIDAETFLKNFESAPVSFVPKEELPEWLISKINFFETGGGTGIASALRVYRGIWNGRVIYYLSFMKNCIMCDFYYESGEDIVWADGDEADKYLSKSKNWKLVYHVEGTFDIGFVPKSSLSDK